MKKRRIIKTVIAVFLAFCIAALVCFISVNIYVKEFSERYFLSAQDISQSDYYDCIVVLGAHVRNDGSPSHMLESRLDKAVELYEKGASEKFLMSGDHGTKEYDEVNNMMNYVLKNTDVERENVFLDHAGFSTYESAYRAKSIFKIEKAVFVTQKYHLYRAVYNARKNGIEAYGVIADDRDWPGITYYKFRESIAIFKDFWYCVFNIKPTYLGEAIPVSGSALASHDIIE